MAFKYRKRDEKTIQDRANQTGGAFDVYIKSTIPRYKVKDTENNLRILPPTWSDTEKWGDNFGIDVYVHYGIGADDATYVCPNKMGNGDCCICDSRADQPPLAEGEQDPLKPGRRVLVYVIDRDDEKTGPQAWAMPWTLERDIQELSIDKELGTLLIDHPDDGYDISFSRQGKNRNIKYVGVKIARRSTPIHDRPKVQEQWLDFIQDNPLPDILHIYDNEYLMKIFRGQVSHRAAAVDDAPAGDGSGRRGSDRGERSARGSDRGERFARGSEGRRGSDRGKTDLEPLKLAEVEDMDERTLTKLIKDYDLTVDPDKYERVSELRARVIEVLQEENLIEEEKPADPPTRSGGARATESGRTNGRGRKGDDAKEPAITTAALDEMDEVALGKLIKQHRLNVNVDDYPRESKLRAAVEDALKEVGLLEEETTSAASTAEARERLGRLRDERERSSDRAPDRSERTSDRPSRSARR